MRNQLKKLLLMLTLCCLARQFLHAQADFKKTYQMIYAQPQISGKTAGFVSMGFGAGYTLGRQWNSQLGTGIGIGYELATTRGQFWQLAPIMASVRWTPFHRLKNQWYLLAESGYGWGNQLINTNGSNFKSHGGYRFHPAMGMIWNTGKTKKWFTEFGYLRQDIGSIQRFDNSNSYRLNQALNRWVIRTGIAF
jgi:hypothetical protein